MFLDGPKLFPSLIAALTLLFVLKAASVFFGVSDYLASAALAQDAEPAAEEPTDDQTSDAVLDEMGEGVVPEPSKTRFTETEIRVLKSLAERRAALDAREVEIETREKMLLAAETRVEDRIDELKDIETRIETMFNKRDEDELAQIQSLVVVYERMKAKDAAKIFQSMDRDILLDVASRMKEPAIAGVLAAMEPESARELTVMLATRTRLPENVDYRRD